MTGGPVLVERERELVLLERLADEVELGASSLAVVTGLPGTGRSALLDRIADRTRERPVQVVAGRGTTAESRLPFGLMSQLVSEIGDRALAGRMSATLDSGAPDDVILQLLCHQFGELAHHRPVLLVLDDIHLLDPYSVRWFLALLRRLRHAPLMLLVSSPTLPFTELDSLETSRSVGVDPDSLHVVSLRPLSRGAVGEVLRAALPSRVDTWLEADVFTATQGNPALVQGAIDRVRASENPAADLAGAAAEAVRDQVRGLLRQLPADLLRELRAISVAGHLLDREQQRYLSGSHSVPVDRAWQRLIATGLVRHGDGPMDPRVAGWILAEMPSAARAELHLEAAEICYRCAVPNEDVAALLLGAGPAGAGWAVEVLVAAASQSEARGDYASTARFRGRALIEPLTPTLRSRLLIELAAVDSAKFPRTGDLRLVQVALEATDGAIASRLAAADRLLARGDSAAALRVLIAVSGAPTITDIEHARLTALYWLAEGSARGAEEFGIPSIADFAGTITSPDLAGAAAWLTAADGHELRAVRKWARAALPFGTGPDRLLSPRIAAAWALMVTDDVPEAITALGGIAAEATNRGERGVAAVALLVRALLYIRGGKLTEAELDVAEAMLGFPFLECHQLPLRFLTAVRILLCLARGDMEGAELVSSLAPPRGHDESLYEAYLLYSQGFLELRMGRPETALHRFEECGRQLCCLGWTNSALLHWRSMAAIAHRLCGNQRAAEKLMTREWELVTAWGVRTAIGVAHVNAGQAVPPAEAVLQLTQAVQLLHRTPSKFEYLHALIGLSAAQLETGEFAGVRRQLRRAEQIATANELDTLLPRIRELAQSVPVQPRATASPRWVDAQGKALSTTSSEVVARVLRGESTVSIARDLAVTTRAVELRLTGIYRHFGVSGREELAKLFAVADEERVTTC
jgi:hypothetical protein